MKRPVVALALAAVASASACSGDARTYSVDDAKAAFALHGYALVDPGSLQFPNVPEGVVIPEGYLVPKTGPSFIVVVASDSEADAAWPDYDRLAEAGSFDARRANVVVIADEAPPARDRERVLAALAALPERGSPIEIAGD